MNFKIDNLQYCNWSRKIFEINREAGLDAVHVTIVYHEDFDELQKVIKTWDEYFKQNSDLQQIVTYMYTKKYMYITTLLTYCTTSLVLGKILF